MQLRVTHLTTSIYQTTVTILPFVGEDSLPNLGGVGPMTVILCMLTKFKDSEFTKHLTPFVLGCLRCVLEMVVLRSHTVLF